MLAEERADAIGTEVGDTILAVPRQNDRVRQHDFLLVDSALEVAQDVVSAGNVVAEALRRMAFESNLGNPVVVNSRFACSCLEVQHHRGIRRELSGQAGHYAYHCRVAVRRRAPSSTVEAIPLHASSGPNRWTYECKSTQSTLGSSRNVGF